MCKICKYMMFVCVFALFAYADQGASFVGKSPFTSLRQSPNGEQIAKLYKSDFLLTSIVGGTDASNPNWIQITIDDMQGVVHKRDIIALGEADYQNYLRSLFLQIFAKLSAPYQQALLADDPAIQTIPKSALESIFAPDSSEISEIFDKKRRLLNALAKAQYQQALHYAIALGFSHTTKQLLEQKSITLDSVPDPKDQSSLPLLIYAIQAKPPRKEIIAALLDKGANINELYGKDPKKSALTLACQNSLIDIAKLLIQAGADLDPAQMTSPLIYAARNHEKELVELLLDSGANIHATLLENGEPTELNALDVALLSPAKEQESSKAEEVIETLINRGANLTHALQSASTSGSTQMIESLLAKGANINGDLSCSQHKGAFACSPLISAIQASQVEVLKTLIRNGADTTIVDDEGRNLVQYTKDIAKDPDIKAQLLEALEGIKE